MRLSGNTRPAGGLLAAAWDWISRSLSELTAIGWAISARCRSCSKAGRTSKTLEIVPGTSWFEIAHPVLRQIKVIGESYIQRDSTEEKPLAMTGFSIELGGNHPLYM